jgi:hypothetical protein
MHLVGDRLAATKLLALEIENFMEEGHWLGGIRNRCTFTKTPLNDLWCFCTLGFEYSLLVVYYKFSRIDLIDPTALGHEYSSSLSLDTVFSSLLLY